MRKGKHDSREGSGSGEGSGVEAEAGDEGGSGGFDPRAARARAEAGSGTEAGAEAGEGAKDGPPGPTVARMRGRPRGRRPRVDPKESMTPEMIESMANVATALYATPFKMLARIAEDPRLDLSPEELSAIHNANKLGVYVLVPKLGDDAPLYFWGACLAAPALARADLIYDGIRKARASARPHHPIPTAPKRPEDANEGDVK